MKMTLELGGHAPVLVFDDCDLDKTLDLLVANKFRNAGQVCVSPTRFHVQQGIYEEFAKGFAERTRAVTVGNGAAAGVQMGPMANPRRARKSVVSGKSVSGRVGRGCRRIIKTK